MRLLLFPLLLISLVGLGQTNSVADSLVRLLKTPLPDTTKTLIYDEIALAKMKSDPTEAMKFGQRGLALAKTIKYPLGQARNINRIGTILRANGSYDQALSRYLEAIKIAKSINDQIGIIKTLNSIGILYAEQNDSKKAIEYYERSKVISEKIGNDRLTQILLLNIGTDFAILEQLDSARFYTQKAYELALQTKANNLNVTLYNLGNIDYRQQKYTAALNNYRRSVPLSKANFDYRILSDTYFEMARLFNETNQRDSALLYAKKALALARQSTNLSTVYEACELLSEIYEQDEPAKALTYFKEATVVKDSLFSIEKATRLRQVEFNEQLRLQEIAKAEEQSRTQQIIGILIGLAIGLLILAFVLYRNNLQKAKTNRLLAGKNEDISRKKQALEASLSKLRETQNQLIQAEKLASLGELTAGIAHEIQNPLNFVNNFSEMSGELVDEILEERNKEGRDEKLEEEILTDLRQNLVKIHHHGQRASNIVNGMLEHSRGKSEERRPVNINKLCDEYLRLAYHGIRAKDKQFNANFRLDADPDLPEIMGVGSDIGRALLNLINNAFYTVRKKNTSDTKDYKPLVVVKTRKIGGKHIEMLVIDNGSGMTDEVVNKVFQPFFTTKPPGEGTGLGLSLTYDIITKGHNGTLDIETQLNEGTTFTVKLPLN